MKTTEMTKEAGQKAGKFLEEFRDLLKEKADR